MPPFELHPLALAILEVSAALHVRGLTGTRLRRRALAGWLILALVVLWPVGDLASSVSLSVATMQRLVIMLAVAPLFLSATTTSRFVAWTRPALVDSLVRRLAHPVVAIVFVTSVGTWTLSTPVVDAGSSSSLVRVLTLVLVLVCGIVLWVPALGVMPGAPRLSAVGRAGFIFVASLVVTSLSFVWIFARHSLYPGLHHQLSLDMTPLFDQQLAGFLAKFGSYVPMWAVAFTIFSRADGAGVAHHESPLHWADVERQLLRADRQRARVSRHGRPGEGSGRAQQEYNDEPPGT